VIGEKRMAMNTKDKRLLKEMQNVVIIERHQMRTITSQVGRQGVISLSLAIGRNSMRKTFWPTGNEKWKQLVSSCLMTSFIFISDKCIQLDQEQFQCANVVFACL
jgi:hypothetical protein